MSNIAVCPNCGGQKTVSKPPYIAGDVNEWVSSGTPMYPCPTCDGHGWIRVDSVPQGDFDNVKFVALSSMETAENLMDECTKRADRIKELETELERTRVGERAADKEIERLLMKIFDIEGREDLVTTELEHRACVAEDRLRVVKELRDELLEDWEAKRYAISKSITVIHELEADIVYFKSAVKGFRALVGNKDLRIADLESQRDMVRKTHDAREEEVLEIINDLTTKNKQLEAYHDRVRDTHQAREVEFSETCERYETDLELLDEILNLVNPLIKSGAYAKPSAESRLLATRMHGLCQTVVQYRRKHNIVG